jgi:hypothetical protein
MLSISWQEDFNSHDVFLAGPAFSIKSRHRFCSLLYENKAPKRANLENRIPFFNSKELKGRNVRGDKIVRILCPGRQNLLPGKGYLRDQG